MFLFESLTVTTVLSGLAVLAALMLVNEIARRSKIASIAIYLVLPIVLTFFVWPKTASSGTSVGTWFHYAKVYSVLAVVMVLWVIRYKEGMVKNKYFLAVPAALLALNILEAVIRDFQVSGLSAGMHDGVFMVGGPWNIMNGIAGILNILAISGWVGIQVTKDKKKDMIWADQIWVWIIPYDLWNFAYVYNCISNHAYYAGFLLLLSCTIPCLFIKKGTWIQARAHTLAIWVMFAMTFPEFQDASRFSVKSHAEVTGGDTTALWIVSSLALISNVLLIGYHVYKIVKYKRNPITGEVHSDTKAYQNAIAGL